MTAGDIVVDAQLRSVLAAAELAREQCVAILDLIESQHETTRDMATLKKELAEQKKALNSHLAKVRGLNRSAILDVRKTKQETADARQQVDTLHLQLQNLKYEQSHLSRQIALCENFEYVYNPPNCLLPLHITFSIPNSLLARPSPKPS
jgi:THO complex subunit 5